MVGKQLAHYKILEQLGSGGMGVVYKALDTRLERHVALKFLPAERSQDELAKQRFMREARAASRLDHPNICTIFDVKEADDGRLYIVMAYYEGDTLKDRLAELPGTKLAPATALAVTRQVAQGLAVAHKNGIVHRDLKPANIMLAGDGQAKILDFGIAKLVESDTTTHEGRVGTAAYMSPEQAQGDLVDRRTDFWSLGVVLYEMLTGERPFAAAFDLALIYSIVNVEHKEFDATALGLPFGLERFVSKALAKDPDHRFQSAAEWIAELDLIEGSVIAASQSADQNVSDTEIRQPDAPDRILVVDDEPELELLMHRKFRKRVRSGEWDFVFAENGKDALEKLNQHHDIELVLTDLNMPEMDGFGLLSAISELPRTLKTVVISAYGDMENIRTAMNRGAFDFIMKPVNFADLETTILKTQQELEALRRTSKLEADAKSRRQEIRIAQQLHDAVVGSGLPKSDRLDTHGFTSLAAETPTDFFDLFEVDDHRMGFSIGSIKAGEVSSPILSITAWSVLKLLGAQGGEPDETVTALSRHLALDAVDDMQADLLYGVIDTDTGQVSCATWGAVDLLKIDESGDLILQTVLGSDRDGKVSGLTVANFDLGRGESLVAFTSGQEHSSQRREYSLSRQQILDAIGKNSLSRPARMIRNVVRIITEQQNTTPQQDDFTILVLLRPAR